MYPGAPGSLSAQESNLEPDGGLTSQTDLVCSNRTSRTNGRNVDIGLWGHGRFRSDDFPPHSLRRDPIHNVMSFLGCALTGSFVPRLQLIYLLKAWAQQERGGRTIGIL